MSITDTEWTRQEAGWYTHPTLGGIRREKDGWWWYLRESDWDDRLVPMGPFASYADARRVAETKVTVNF